uniref:Kinesin motor domain-containing protein n=1 Tax=Callorhinchus milii TaxID=7868 RepID=A0A4W3ISY1_CALMI
MSRRKVLSLRPCLRFLPTPTNSVSRPTIVKKGQKLCLIVLKIFLILYCAGKIRVFCRIRPLSKSEIARGSQCVVHSPDEYTVAIEGNRGVKALQFDQVFNSSASQEEIFSDTKCSKPHGRGKFHMGLGLL